MKDPRELVSTARKAFNSGKTKTYEFRYKTLQALQRFVEENEKQIIEILKKENGKPQFEAMSCEVIPIKNDIQNALYKLKDWMKPLKVEKSIAFMMDQPIIQYDPFGVVLVMGAWNYPLMLTLSPVIGAIAAGNCVVIKPSDVTPLCGQFLEENLPKYLDKECFPVFNGGIPETTSLLGSKIAMGGETDKSKLYIEPTIVTEVKKDDPIMTEEIFGPVLPIYTVETPEEAIEFINSGEKPLAIYVFGNSKTLQQKFLTQTSSGGVCFNDTLMQFTCDSLPFGGVGNSGMGMYHGKFSFETFSHKKGTLVKKLTRVGEMITSVRYPPYTENHLKILAVVTKKIPPIPGSKYFCQIAFGLILALFWYIFKSCNH